MKHEKFQETSGEMLGSEQQDLWIQKNTNGSCGFRTTQARLVGSEHKWQLWVQNNTSGSCGFRTTQVAAVGSEQHKWQLWVQSNTRKTCGFTVTPGRVLG